MKKLLSILTILLFSIRTLNAQIDIRENDIINAPIEKPAIYDSIENIKYLYTTKTNTSDNNLNVLELLERNEEEFKKYIGQTIFFIPYTDQNRLKSTNTFFYYLNKSYYKKSQIIENENIISIKNRKQIFETQNRLGLMPKEIKYEQFIFADTINSYVETNVYLAKDKYYSDGRYASNEQEQDSKNSFYTPLEEIIGKYYKIIDISFDKQNDYYSKVKFIICDEKNDTLYFFRNRLKLFESPNDICIVGFYEKTKNIYSNKNFIYAPNFYNLNQNNLKANNYDSVGNPVIPDINTGVQVTINENSIWKIQKVQFLKIETELVYQLYFILSNDKGNEIKVNIKDIKEFFIQENEYKKELLRRITETKKSKSEQIRISTQKQQQKQIAFKKKELNNIDKFGYEFGSLINKRKVVLGMTKEMCRASWGSPIDVNTTIIKGLTSEQWVYSYKTYLYFSNGQLTAIQK